MAKVIPNIVYYLWKDHGKVKRWWIKEWNNFCPLTFTNWILLINEVMYFINTKTSIQISTNVNKGNKTIYNNNPKAFNKMSISENSFSRLSLNRVLEIFIGLELIRQFARLFRCINKELNCTHFMKLTSFIHKLNFKYCSWWTCPIPANI
jgi:hypothetical protein